MRDKRMNMPEGYEPLIIAFCCNWCAYDAADLAGTSRKKYPHNLRIIRVRCSGMVHPNLVMNALMKGADGVLICGCHPGDCHYVEGNLRAKDRAEAIKLMVEDFGLEKERFRLEWISGSEADKLVQVAKSMTKELKKLGPSMYG